MKRVVVTGMGIVSSIGNNTQEVMASLREAKSGIVRADKYAELGFRCQVHGAPTLDPSEAVDRRAMRFLGGGAAWNHVAMEQAIRDSGLSENEVSNERTGIVMGSGGPSTRTIVESADITRSKGPKRVGPFAVPKAMSSTASATLATWFKIKGVNYSISSACATSNHCIGNAYETDSGWQAGHDLRGRHARSSTGRCRCCLTPWARCRRNSTRHRTRRRAPTTPIATAS
jgi:3-oxoacyl-[acyl-carrier-protein] synthase-1